MRPRATASPTPRPTRSEHAPRGLSDWLGAAVVRSVEGVFEALDWAVRRPLLALLVMVLGAVPVLWLGLLAATGGLTHREPGLAGASEDDDPDRAGASVANPTSSIVEEPMSWGDEAAEEIEEALDPSSVVGRGAGAQQHRDDLGAGLRGSLREGQRSEGGQGQGFGRLYGEAVPADPPPPATPAAASPPVIAQRVEREVSHQGYTASGEPTLGTEQQNVRIEPTAVDLGDAFRDPGARDRTTSLGPSGGPDEQLMPERGLRADFEASNNQPIGQPELRAHFESFDIDGELALGGTTGFDYRGSAAATLAGDWLAQRELIAHLTFVEAGGYWANTYVPGDPLARGLRQRLQLRHDLADSRLTGFALARPTSPVSQPFDVPDDAALAVYLQADRRQVEGESRVLLQVGLQATERRPGRRPAMNVVVVLDRHRRLTQAQSASVRALLEALSAAHDVGDRFSLIATGPTPRVAIEPGDFRYGSVQVAALELLEREASDALDQGESVLRALDLAIERLGAENDPTAPLGSSLVLLVTPGELGAVAEDLAAYAHAAAIEGVPLSVVGVGAGVDVGELDGIVLAGQGNRRLLVEPGAARELVDRELTAAGRAVARAVRLRIRLAPGVRLVDVVGSVRLDTLEAERVRSVERAVDVQVSRALGIQADRGDDEDGIQIVIPAFYAGDSHVLLLDLVVPGAGPVADVTARYKDLVFLRNAVAADNLALRRGAAERGPLEQNVLANLLAWELAESLASAGALCQNGQFEAAAQTLRDFIDLVRGLRVELPGFATDPALHADLELLSSYLEALERRDVSAEDLGESLLYASFLKRLRPPAE